jgi:hypothetical protein
MTTTKHPERICISTEQHGVIYVGQQKRAKSQAQSRYARLCHNDTTFKAREGKATNVAQYFKT